MGAEGVPRDRGGVCEADCVGWVSHLRRRKISHESHESSRIKKGNHSCGFVRFVAEKVLCSPRALAKEKISHESHESSRIKKGNHSCGFVRFVAENVLCSLRPRME